MNALESKGDKKMEENSEKEFELREENNTYVEFFFLYIKWKVLVFFFFIQRRENYDFNNFQK